MRPRAAILRNNSSRGTHGRATTLEVGDFKQAGDLYRLQPKDAQQRLADNSVGSGR
jgi:hypothetical protein